LDVSARSTEWPACTAQGVDWNSTVAVRVMGMSDAGKALLP